MESKGRLIILLVGFALLLTAGCSSSKIAQERYVNQVIANQQAVVDQHDYQQAVEPYRQALKRYPNDERLLYNLGYLYLAQSAYEQAQEVFIHLTTLNPQHTQALLALASAFDLAGERESAQQEWARALVLEPNQVELAYRLIESLKESNQVEAATEVACGLYHQGHYNARLFTLLADLAELNETGSGAAWAALAELYP